MLNIVEAVRLDRLRPARRSARARPSSGASWSRRRSWPTPISCATTAIRGSAEVPVKRLISKSHAASLCGKITSTKLEPAARHGSKPSLRYHGTRRHRLSHHRRSVGQHGVVDPQHLRLLRVADPVPPYGFLLHDRGSFFARSEEAERRCPAQAAVHHDHPAFVMKDGQPLISFGNMGGGEQAEAQATEIVNMVDLGMNVRPPATPRASTTSQAAEQVDLETAVRPGRRAAQGDGPRCPFGRTETTTVRRATRHPLPARAGPHHRREWDDRRSAGERRLPGRIGLPQGRSGGRLVESPRREVVGCPQHPPPASSSWWSPR